MYKCYRICGTIKSSNLEKYILHHNKAQSCQEPVLNSANQANVVVAVADSQPLNILKDLFWLIAEWKLYCSFLLLIQFVPHNTQVFFCHGLSRRKKEMFAYLL